MNARPSIAFFGSSLVSAYWNGAATYYRGLLRALSDHDFPITFYEPDAFDRQQHRDIPDPEWAEVVVYPATDEGVERALERARGSDVVVKASGIGVYDEHLAKSVPEIRRPGGLAVYWDVDAPATLERLERDEADSLHQHLRSYDHVLTYGGGPPVREAYLRVGARRCVPIYNALDPRTHHPAEPDERFRADLAFLGNRLPDRERRMREFFFEPARRRPGRRVDLGGWGWDSEELAPNVRHLGHVYTADHNAFNSTPRAVLNVNRESMARIGYSPATRVFEAAGAGACLITDRWDGIERFLEPGEEVLVADSAEALLAHFDHLTPERARAIGTAARRRILAEHTYRHRAETVAEMLDPAGARAVTP